MTFHEERDVPASNTASQAAAEESREPARLSTAEGQPGATTFRVALLGAVGFLAAISWQPIMPFLPIHLSRIGFTTSQVGILVSLLSLAMGAVELEVGRIAGVFGRRWTLLGGFLANTVALIWLAQARMAWAVAGALVAVGAVRATMWAPLFAEVADVASVQTRARTFGVFWFWTSVAFLVGPALGGLVVSLYKGLVVFYLGCAFSLLAIPLVIAATSPSRPTLGITVAGAEKVLGIPAVLRLCMANLLFYSVTGIWSAFLPLSAYHQHVSPLTIGWVFTFQGLAYALVQVPTGRLIDRVGPDRLILPALIGRGALAAIAPLFHSSAAFLIGATLFGLIGGFLPVTFTTLVTRLVPREHYTTAMGVYNSSGDIGFFIGPLLGGVAAGLPIGILAPFFLCVPLAAAGLVMGLSATAAARAQAPELL